MSKATKSQEQQSQAQLAAKFNELYLNLSSPIIKYVGNYEIVREIGEGAYGKVYLAKHMLLNTKVVLKCGLTEDPNIVREIYYHKMLKHKNVVRLYEVIKTEKHLWIVLEYCEGNELFYHIYEKKKLELKECRKLFYQIVKAIKYIHSLDLSHRDLKLENILLADKKKSIIKITDFGFVREFKRKFLSTVCGTAVYMAPELLKGEKYSGFAIDIWALGVILFTMLYGEMPFDEDDELKTKYKIIHEEPNYRDTLPQDIIDLLKRMLSKDPISRPNLNDILNSSFLIDLSNEETYRRSDTDSIISINQHYNSYSQPFQTKIEKNLLKKLQKININIFRLQDDVINNEMNSLTAFYELFLTHEYSKKKRRYKNDRRRKYHEARKSLKKSRRKVKSALSLDQSTQPLEKIMSSLSLNSYRTNTNTHSSTIRPSISKRNSDRIQEYGNNSEIHPRSISFVDNSSMTNSASNFASNNDYSQPRKMLKRLQFWKKNKLESNGELKYFEGNMEKRMDDAENNSIDINGNRNRNTSSPLEPTEEQATEKKPIDDSLTTPKARPLSVLSQMSQNSHLSQISSTMISELEMDILDETDTMDEDYDDDNYESSISTTQERYSMGTSTSASVSIRPNKYRRTLSDISVKSNPNSITTKHKKKPSLSQLSSNSSEDSSSLFNGIISPSPTNPNSNFDTILSPAQIARATSPDFTKKNKIWKSKASINSIRNQDVVNRANSPPFPLSKDTRKPVRPGKNNWKLNGNQKELERSEENGLLTSMKVNANRYEATINEEEED